MERWRKSGEMANKEEERGKEGEKGKGNIQGEDERTFCFQQSSSPSAD